MEVILLEKIHKLGNIGDTVSVKAGFARNFLLPQGKAAPATEENKTKMEAHRAELEKKMAEQVKASEARAAKLAALSVTIEAQVSEEGALYGSINVGDIAKAVTDAGVELAKNEVQLPEGPIRAVGEFTIAVLLPGDVEGSVKVAVVGVES